jgi:hypothetical protein
MQRRDKKSANCLRCPWKGNVNSHVLTVLLRTSRQRAANGSKAKESYGTSDRSWRRILQFIVGRSSCKTHTLSLLFSGSIQATSTRGNWTAERHKQGEKSKWRKRDQFRDSKAFLRPPIIRVCDLKHSASLGPERVFNTFMALIGSLRKPAAREQHAEWKLCPPIQGSIDALWRAATSATMCRMF